VRGLFANLFQDFATPLMALQQELIRMTSQDAGLRQDAKRKVTCVERQQFVRFPRNGSAKHMAVVRVWQFRYGKIVGQWDQRARILCVEQGYLAIDCHGRDGAGFSGRHAPFPQNAL